MIVGMHSPAPPETDDQADLDSHFHDDTNQVPADCWDNWAAARDQPCPGFGCGCKRMPCFEAIQAARDLFDEDNAHLAKLAASHGFRARVVLNAPGVHAVERTAIEGNN